MILFLQIAEKLFGFIFFARILHGKNFYLNIFRAKSNLNNVSGFHILRRLRYLAIDLHAASITSLVCHGSALNQPRNF